MSAPIGAHASALIALRAKSLQAYGIDPKVIMVTEDATLDLVVESPTRALAKVSREERALAVQSEHAFTII